MSVTWGGSLIGSLNPDSTGYDVHKRRKLENSTLPADVGLPSSVIVKFRPINDDGSSSENDWPQLDLPIGTTVAQLEALVNDLLENSDNETTPFAFYVANNKDDDESKTTSTTSKTTTTEDIEIVKSLFDTIKSNALSTENVLSLTYMPLSLFRVKPVTRCTDTMPGHTDAVLHVTYSPCGRFLASGGGDTTVRFWDVNTCLPRKTCAGHKNHVLVTGWSPDGRRFGSADKNGLVIVWDPITGDAKKTIKAHSKWITSMSWEPMHRNMSCERLCTSSKDCLVKIWNVRTGSCEATLSGHIDSVECCRWGGEGLIYSASRDRTIKVWGAEVDSSNSSSSSNSNSNSVGKLVRTLTGHGHRVNTLALNCESVCRTGPYDHNGYRQFASDTEAYEAAVDRYTEIKKTLGAEVLVSGSDDFTLFFWKPQESKHPLKRLTGHQQAVNDIKFSPDGRYFASASFDKKIKLWDGRNGNFFNTLTGHVGPVYCVSWSSDSRYLVSASKDSTVKLWEAKDCKRCKETLPGHEDEVYALDWSPNGVSVASGSKDRTIKVWKH
ncbi:hypothetical protein ScalyP_jg2970 [Parmales sp. scaly parma]|nr:hypothetical protein ScalyP_jg2970 [Parmales sp. scaly parma]